MLTITNLSKKYKKNDSYSLKDISFTLKEGEIVGLIGKNGAGKTTLMKIIAKTIRPSTGDVIFNNNSILNTSNSLRDFGFMIDGQFYDHLSAEGHLKYFISLNGKSEHLKNIKPVLELVDIWRNKDKNPKSFSFGMKQRLSLALCLVTEPKILIMDEPFVGLDPNGVNDLIQTLQEWVKSKNSTILISSHQLSELEAICDRYIFIEQGKIKDSFIKDSNTVKIIKLKNDFNPDTIKNQNYLKQILIHDSKNIEINVESDIFNSILSDIINSNEIVNIQDKTNSLAERFIGGNYE